MFAVLTEWPVTRPFTRADKLLRALLSDVTDLDELTWLSTVPEPAEGIVESRVPARISTIPSFDMRRRARAGLIAELEAADVINVLLVGATALDSWRGDLKLEEWHGRGGRWLDRWNVMAIHSPAAAFRRPGLKEVIRGDLARFVGTGGRMPVCAKCTRGTFDHEDMDDVPYCTRHWPHFGGQWRKERERWYAPLDQLELL